MSMWKNHSLSLSHFKSSVTDSFFQNHPNGELPLSAAPSGWPTHHQLHAQHSNESVSQQHQLAGYATTSQSVSLGSQLPPQLTISGSASADSLVVDTKSHAMEQAGFMLHSINQSNLHNQRSSQQPLATLDSHVHQSYQQQQQQQQQAAYSFAADLNASAAAAAVHGQQHHVSHLAPHNLPYHSLPSEIKPIFSLVGEPHNQQHPGSDSSGSHRSSSSSANGLYGPPASSLGAYGQPSLSEQHAHAHQHLSRQTSNLLKPLSAPYQTLTVTSSVAPSKSSGHSFTCTICNEQFSLKAVFQSHMKTHALAKVKPKFHCHLCGNIFSQKTSLNRHMKSHTGERPFHCTLCSKSFSEKERLKIHMRTHTGEKPFSCTLCGKTFSQKSTVKRHQTVHTGEKKFRCDCGKGFANRGNLLAHIRTRGGLHHTE